MSLAVEVVGKTDVGCVRTNNEDNFGYDTRCGVFVVCDGMGGQAAGEVASKLAVDSVLTYFREAAKTGGYPLVGQAIDGVSEQGNALASAIHLANTAIRETAKHHVAQEGMGSTIVAVLVKGNFFSIANVGDSRIYMVRYDAIQQLTRDHSLVMEQVRRGLISLEDARTSEMQNIIIRALGPDDNVDPDLDDIMAMEGDLLVLCSDGLTRHVDDDKILETVRNAPTLEQASEQLIQLAKEGGGSDNVTCLLLRFVNQPWYKKLFNWILPGGSAKWQNSI
jgi:serine/threonine protein phosphatase PrpC